MGDGKCEPLGQSLQKNFFLPASKNCNFLSEHVPIVNLLTQPRPSASGHLRRINHSGHEVHGEEHSDKLLFRVEIYSLRTRPWSMAFLVNPSTHQLHHFPCLLVKIVFIFRIGDDQKKQKCSTTLKKLRAFIVSEQGGKNKYKHKADDLV